VAIALGDMSNCYNRIAHAMASLIFQDFGVPTSAVESILRAIENMKLFLQTGLGDSASFVGGGISIKTQGLCQGNGASLAGWAVISICILKAHGRKGHGVEFFCPITQLQHYLSAILYVDDTNLLHIDLTKNESMDEVHMAIQDSINSWGNLLIATGGVLNLQNASTLSSLLNGPTGCGIMCRMSYEENLASQYPSRVATKQGSATSQSTMQRRRWEQ
jgi:hypothetical protein